MNYQRYFQELLEITLQKGASDLHISINHPPVLRITKELIELEGKQKLTGADCQGLAFTLMSPQQKEQFLKERELDFAYEIRDRARFRVNAFFQRNNISLALRAIPSKIKSIEDLNLPPVLYRLAEAQQGFVLITGATSQGKSTTLAAIIDEINHNRKEHIITIEDPIEYVFKEDKCLIDQREVYRDTLSFSRALKATLREDPDVIMVGEMRDLETISTAITAAETGHLVFATLHTNSASQTVHRIIDVFPPYQQNQIRAQLAISLLGVVSQKLLSRKEGGFVPACEIMFNNSAVGNLIRENRIHEILSIIETSRDKGMITLNASLVELVKKKEITKEIALLHSLNQDDLQARLSKL